MTPVRCCLFLLALLAATACGGSATHPSAGPAPAADGRVVPAGASVRAHLWQGEQVTGSLMMPFRPASPEVAICESASPCATLTAPGVRVLPVASVQRLEVRGSRGGSYGYLGFFAGGLAGLAAGDDETGGALLALGAFAGWGVGAVVGSRVNGWKAVFPCHLGCGWSTEPAGGPAAR